MINRSVVFAIMFGVPGVSVANELTQVQITATKVPAPVADVPASISIVQGTELRLRGATDLRTATALIAGVDAAPGGDAGPASAVPSLMGVSEFDAFLLVLDGVPWGGAFNPAIASLNFHDVQRLELMRGAAPVMFGATSFVGVIHVLRYPAGEADNILQLGADGVGSVNGSLSTALPELANYRQSLALDVDHLRHHGERQGIDTEHILYRVAETIGTSTVRMDAEYSNQRQLPGSPVVLSGSALTKATPLDSNFNPVNAEITDRRAHLRFELSRDTALGQWDSILSLVRSNGRDVRGFLRPGLINDPRDSLDGYNADGFDQHRRIDNVYADTHLNLVRSPLSSLTVGFDWLHGKATQESNNFGYFVPLDGGRSAPSSQTQHVDEINGIEDRREFGGVYAQLDQRLGRHWDVLAGLRYNSTSERRVSKHLDSFDSTNNKALSDQQTNSRWTGMLGVRFSPWRDDDGLPNPILYANFRDAFKPAAIDLGPDVRPAILKPEAARSYEVGAKGAWRGGLLNWEVSAFHLEFHNLVVAQTDADGKPILANAGNERLQGVELESRWRLGAALTLLASYSYHDASFGDTSSAEKDQTVNLRGHRLALSPHHLGAVGLLYATVRGCSASLVAKYVGDRYLNRLNTASALNYTTVDGQVGYALGKYTLALNAYNLTNRRDVAAGSEFGESSFYLLPARRVSLRLTRAL